MLYKKSRMRLVRRTEGENLQIQLKMERHWIARLCEETESLSNNLELMNSEKKDNLS